MTEEHPDVKRMREYEERCIAYGYTEGDVNHNIQPLIGSLRYKENKGEDLDRLDMAYFVQRMSNACDAEIAFLAKYRKMKEDVAHAAAIVSGDARWDGAKENENLKDLLTELVTHVDKGYGPLTRGHRRRIEEALNG